MLLTLCRLFLPLNTCLSCLVRVFYVIMLSSILMCHLFLSFSTVETPNIKTPLHTIIKLCPAAYGCRVEEIIFPIQGVDNEK